MRALVTGASGFIGSTLIEELGTLGFEVDALMRKTSSAANLEGLKFRRVEGDLSDEQSLRTAVRDVDYIFHLAGVTVAPNRAGYFAHNAHGTERLARIAAEERPGLQRFVYVSSLAASGPALSREPLTEQNLEKPVSAYGESKLEGERALLRFKSVYPISIIRPPMVYGPKDKAVFVMIQPVARNLMPLLRGSTEGGHKYYSSIHVRDLCRGIVQSALAPAAKVPSGEVFFLTGDHIHTYMDIMNTIAECLGRDPLRIRVPKFAVKLAATALSGLGSLTRRTFPLNLDKLNEVLPDYWICSNQKAKDMLGFAPEYDLASGGMSHTIEWYRKQKWL
jgi:dihydroflavonol-4-reductase